MSNSGNSEEKFFNLHVTGCGYLQRARQIKPKGKGKPYLAVTIVALVGDAANVERRYIDCIVCGEQAKQLVEQYKDAINDREHSVFVTFRAGDIWAETYTRSKDGKGPDAKKAGEVDVSLKGRLLWLGLVRIDKQEVYRAAERQPVDEAKAEAA